MDGKPSKIFEPGAAETFEIVPLREVVIDGLAVLKMVKHCNDNLPSLVSGSLLGLDVNGVLEITYAYPVPVPKSLERHTSGDAGTPIPLPEDGEQESDLEGSEYQMEMLKMLREVNVDNNCVGWYQAMYLGTISPDTVSDQISYQASEGVAISHNSVVVMYDPIQSKRGNLVIKAYRLSEEFLKMRNKRAHGFLRPGDILQELPVRIRNAGHVSAFIRCLQDSHKSELMDGDFDALSMTAGDAITERHLELMGTMIDELVSEQQRFHQHARLVAKPRQEQIKWLTKRLQENAEKRSNGDPELPTRLEASGQKPLPDAPPRMDALLSLGQLERYCDQVSGHVDSSFQKLIVSASLHSTSSSN